MWVFSSDYCFLGLGSLIVFSLVFSVKAKKCAVDRICKNLAGIKKKQNQHWRLFAALSICESGAGVQHVPPDSSDEFGAAKVILPKKSEIPLVGTKDAMYLRS